MRPVLTTSTTNVANKTIIEEKRRQRIVGLAEVRDVSQAQYVFLKATGSFTTLHINDDKPILLYLILLASEIVTHIENGEWTASEVLEAYIARAAFAQSRTNCLTEGVVFLSNLCENKIWSQ